MEQGMIILHNPHDKASRDFVDQHGAGMQVLEYPDCIQQFPQISAFPSVVEQRGNVYAVARLPQDLVEARTALDAQWLGFELDLGDRLEIFLDMALRQYADQIDAATEVAIRQMQKSLAALPLEMPQARFAEGVRPIIVNFQLPDNPLVQQLKQTILDMVDAVLNS
jgi:hypothetical protein